MVVSGDSVLVDGVAALARVQRSALRIHDPRVVLGPVLTSSQVDDLVGAIRTDAARAVSSLGRHRPDAGAGLARLGAAELSRPGAPSLRAWATEVAGASDELLRAQLVPGSGAAQAVDDRVRELVKLPRALDAAERDELAVLVGHAGARQRLGLVDRVQRATVEHGRFEHVLATSPEPVVERLRAAWRAQLDLSPDAAAARAAALLDEHGITSHTAEELRTLLVDLDAARTLRLPNPGRGIGAPGTVLDGLVAGDPAAGTAAARLERLWSRARSADGLPTGARLDTEARATLAAPLGAPGDSIALLHVLHDLGGAAAIVAERHEPTLQRILDPVVRHADGWGTLDDAEVARLRLLARSDSAAAAQLVDAAVARARSGRDGDLLALRTTIAEPGLRRTASSRDQLALLAPAAPQSIEDVRPWLEDVERVVAATPDIPADLHASIGDLVARAYAFLDGLPPADKAAGYRGHPDYAELGSLAQHLRLADALTPRSGNVAAASGVITW